MLNDKELNDKLEQSPAERVTKEYIESRIVQTTFHNLYDYAAPIKPGANVTICNIELDNGFSVRGESACVKTKNYDKSIGERIAYDDAFKKLWSLFGFLLAEKGTLK